MHSRREEFVRYDMRAMDFKISNEKTLSFFRAFEGDEG
jgi:hypothetical protein